MKKSRLNRFAWIFLALTVAAIAAVSSNIYQGKSTKNATCINQISGLSQEQKDQITSLGTQHQTAMTALREKRQATTDVNQKVQIRTEMDSQIQSHLNSAKAILNADQIAQFDQIARNGNSGQKCKGQGNGQRGSGTCDESYSGRRGR